MQLFEYFGIISAAIVGLGAVETFTHSAKLKKIRHRIHVSGTRGKSSVTRLIASGFRESGMVTVAKTTGTLSRTILPDGRELPVFRPLGPNIIEQKRIISVAAQLKAEALVIECMALQPELHWISENKLVHATHGVITNIRPDHLDIMGPTPVDVAKAISGMIPLKGKLFTAEQKYLDILRAAADDRHTKLISVTADEISSVSDAELSGFSYIEHRENVALVLKVLDDFGIRRGDAVKAMWKARPDPGVLTEHKLDFFGRKVIFVNAFAANDPESTEKIWNLTLKKHPDIGNIIAVLNLREDRPSRTLQLARETKFWHSADRVVLMGTGAYQFARVAAKEIDYPESRFIYAEQDTVEDIFEKIIEVCGKSTLVIGMGNIGGSGFPLVRFFKNRANIGGVNV